MQRVRSEKVFCKKLTGFSRVDVAKDFRRLEAFRVLLEAEGQRDAARRVRAHLRVRFRDEIVDALGFVALALAQRQRVVAEERESDAAAAGKDARLAERTPLVVEGEDHRLVAIYVRIVVGNSNLGHGNQECA